MKKRFLAALLTLCMLFALAPVTAMAEDGEQGRSLTLNTTAEFHIMGIDTIKAFVAQKKNVDAADVVIKRIEVHGSSLRFGEPGTAAGVLINKETEYGWWVENVNEKIKDESVTGITIYATVNGMEVQAEASVAQGEVSVKKLEEKTLIEEIYLTVPANTFTVTYTDGVEGEEIFADQRHTVKEGEATPAFEGTPTRKNYTFTGWSPEVAETVTENVTYAAQWTVNDVNENGVADTDETFAGYYVLVPGKVSPENGALVASSYYPYAEETIGDVKVDYTTGYLGGITPAAKDAVDALSGNVKRLVITKENYDYLNVPHFYGGKVAELLNDTTNGEKEIVWYQINNSSLSKDWPKPNKETVAGYHVDGYIANVAINVVYYANYEGAETASFNDENLLSGQRYVVKPYVQTGLTNREGYTFVGWNTKADGTGTAYASAQEIDPLINGMALYAQWKQDEVKPTPSTDPTPSAKPADPAPTPKDEHPEIAQAIKDGTWGKASPSPAPAAAKPAAARVPQTGDTANPVLWAALMAAALAAFAAVVVVRRRSSK